MIYGREPGTEIMHEPMETSSFKTEICQCENEDEE
jgi:hypothetical protein